MEETTSKITIGLWLVSINTRTARAREREETGAMKKLREELSALKAHLTQHFFMSYKPSSFSTVKM